MKRLRRVAIAMALAPLAACVVLAGVDGDYMLADADAGPDVAVAVDGAVDASPDITLDAPDATTPDAELLPNGGFDVDGSGCGGGWSRENAALTHDPTAHAGSRYSCRICRVAPTVSAFTAGFELKSPEAGTYKVLGWSQQAAGAFPPIETLIRVRYVLDGGPDSGFEEAGVTQNWQSQSQEVTVPDGGAQSLIVEVGGAGSQGPDCVLWDSVTLTRE